MLPTLFPQEFVAKWRRAELKESSAYQSHFNDLRRLAGPSTPVEDDPTGEQFAFETGASKSRDGQGWADVWTEQLEDEAAPPWAAANGATSSVIL
jgi:hypothetical protein